MAAPYVDVAELALYSFFGFFLALVFYLRREDRREGYPLEDDISGRVDSDNSALLFDDAKTFLLPFDRGTVTTPTGERDPQPDNVTYNGPRYAGTPFEPTGNPLSSGVGPGAYAQRKDWPDLDYHGNPRVVPMRVAADILVADVREDPRGMPVTGCDGIIAGTVADLWIDRADHVVRYFEVALSGGGTALLPQTMSVVHRRHVSTDSITAAQFAGSPGVRTPDQITFLEEEKVQAYFGAGYLWATPGRSEPYL